MSPAIGIAVVCLFAASVRGDWPQFRGRNSSGISQKSGPVEFGPGKNELWSLSLNAGHSSPCVAGDVLFVTTFNKSRRAVGVVCIGCKDGKVRWRRELPIERFETGHPSFNPASSSPASDGRRVVAYFGSYGLVCFDMDGRKQWEIRLPLPRSYAGNATSPAIIGDRVILYRGNHVDHFILAVDKRSGKQLWRVEQEEPFVSELACTACPIVAGDKLIVHSARSVQALDLKNGKRIWVAKCATTATSTPVLAGDEVVVAAWNKMGEPALRPKFPAFEELVARHDKDRDKQISADEFPRLMIFHRPDGAEAPQNGAALRFQHTDSNRDGEISASEWAAKLGQLAEFRARYKTHGVIAIPLDSQGLVPAHRIRTLETQGIPEVPSPLIHEGYVHFVKNGGVLTTLDLAAGKRVSRVRTRGRGTHYASPIIAGDKLYSTAGDGTISVLSLGSRPKVVAVNPIGERVYATPAIVAGVLYVRTFGKLYAFAKTPAGSN